MADVAFTPASIKPADGNGTIIRGIAGATILQGNAVYFDPATSTYKLAQANAAATQKAVGYALQSVSSGQGFDIFTYGNLTINAVGVPAKVALLSSGAAGATTATDADVTAGQYGTIMGAFTSTTNLFVNIIPTQVVR